MFIKYKNFIINTERVSLIERKEEVIVQFKDGDSYIPFHFRDESVRDSVFKSIYEAIKEGKAAIELDGF